MALEEFADMHGRRGGGRGRQSQVSPRAESRIAEGGRRKRIEYGVGAQVSAAMLVRFAALDGRVVANP